MKNEVWKGEAIGKLIFVIREDPSLKNHKMLLERLKLYKVPSELIAEIEAEFEEMKKRSDRYLEQLLDARHKLIKQDAILENQKTTIEKTRKALERLTRQNESMKTLLMEEWR